MSTNDSGETRARAMLGRLGVDTQAMTRADLTEIIGLILDRDAALRDGALTLGSTGRPAESERPDDGGELRAALSWDPVRRFLFMEFGKPVSWLSMTSAHARHIAKMLTDAADAVDNGPVI